MTATVILVVTAIIIGLIAKIEVRNYQQRRSNRRTYFN